MDPQLKNLDDRLRRLENADPAQMLRPQLNFIRDPIFTSGVSTPASSAALGTYGSFVFDDNYIYIYVSTGWKRVAIAAF